MGTVRMKQEEETDKNNSKKVIRNLEEREVVTKGKGPLIYGSRGHNNEYVIQFNNTVLQSSNKMRKKT